MSPWPLPSGLETVEREGWRVWMEGRMDGWVKEETEREREREREREGNSRKTLGAPRLQPAGVREERGGEMSRDVTANSTRHPSQA